MKFFLRALRLLRIQRVFMRYRLDEFYLPTWIKLITPWRFLHKTTLSRGIRLRLALESLGPIFVKAGQILSTRRDLLPPDIAQELAKLQDRVPPFSGQVARAIAAESYPQPLANIFAEFDEIPVASASIAQVHHVKLLDGRLAVAKILRPNIHKMILRDIDLLTTLAKLAERFSAKSRQFKPLAMVQEISTTLMDELDLLREGANAAQLRRNFLASDLLSIPEIYWQLSHSSMLVMERVAGVPINQIDRVTQSQVEKKLVAENLIKVFFTQVFRDSFFHADMHPGNIFISTNPAEMLKLIQVDFGIVGSLNDKDKRYLAENMLAFTKRDYQRVAQLHVSSGWIPPDTRVDQFEGAIRAVCEPIFGKPIKEISFGQLLMRLFQAAQRFNINIQPQLILLQKTLINVEGVAAQIYPELDMWTIARPYLEKWLKQEMGPGATLRKIKNNLPFWAEKMPDMPMLVHEALSDFTYQQAQKRFAQPQDFTQVVRASKIKFLQGLSAAFVTSSAILFFQQALGNAYSAGFLILSLVCFCLSELI